MKLCLAYKIWINQDSFAKSKSQWDQYQQRSGSSFYTGPPRQLNEPTEIEPILGRLSLRDADDKSKGDFCCLCSVEGTDETGKPRKGVRLSVIAENARRESEKWDGEDLNQLRKYWEICSTCKNELDAKYQNELALDLADEFASFVGKKFPDDRDMQLEYLSLKLGVLSSMDALDPKQKEDAEQLANTIISVIERIKLEDKTLPMQMQCLEIFVYNSLGCLALLGATKESGIAAVEYFEKCRRISRSIGDADWSATADANLELAKSTSERSTGAQED